MLLIHKVSAASSSNTFKYFDSTHLFGFTQESTYTCSVADISYDDGQVLLVGIDALRSAYTVPVLAARIGLEKWEAAQLLSFSSPAENLNGALEISITIREDKKVVDDGALSNLARCIPAPEKLAAISESYEFSRTDSGISWNRSVSVQYANLGDINFLRHAGIFVKNLFILGRPNYGFFSDELSGDTRFDGAFRPLISESYDLINHSVQFSESFSAANLSADSTCSVSKSHSISFEEGFKNKVISLSVKAVKEPLEVNLAANVKSLITSIKNEENTEFGEPHSIDKTVSGQSADLTISFSTDQRKTTAEEYSVEKTKSGGFYDFSVSRSLRGRGPNLTGWDSVYTAWKAAISASSKVTGLFGPLTLFEKSRNTSFNRFEGSIQESIVYTDNPEYRNPNSDNVLKSSKKISDAKPVERIYRYSVLGDSEKVQRRFEGESDGKTLGTLRVSVEMIKKKTTDWDSFLTLAFAEINEAPAISWVTSKTASIDVNEGKVSAQIEYNYVN